MRSYWLCRCSCPKKTETIVRRDTLGVTNSCGCLQTEYAASGIAPLKHGHSIGHSSEGKPVSPEYSTWISMKTRCCNPRSPKYPDYGGRGIRVCDQWIKSFETFLADVGPKPKPLSKYSIHRIDNDGNYEPGNVCWATAPVQQKTKRPDRDIIDRIGDVFGRLTVVRFAGSRGKRKKRYWICQCECGRQIEVRFRQTLAQERSHLAAWRRSRSLLC